MPDPAVENQAVQVTALVARVEELGVEVAELRRAVLSMGSALLVGGLPGGAGYVAWHNVQVPAVQADFAAEEKAKKIAELEAALAAAKAPPPLPPAAEGSKQVPPSLPSTSGAGTGSSGSQTAQAASSSTPAQGANAPGPSS